MTQSIFHTAWYCGPIALISRIMPTYSLGLVEYLLPVLNMLEDAWNLSMLSLALFQADHAVLLEKPLKLIML
ncbi:hypothetical protein MKW98_004366 [Papaver atlanticum]|uniref:Uncharacterized protein n=1 Tax=Papaver atlanticum TaxID=357466 RepID=A0AAD4SQS4_9MAGN|nr:hypothetical protein MKW98_004366 [Papaver atlanticum]